MAKRTWTDDDDALLTLLWLDGQTAQQIAVDKFPERSKNAIIGRVHRLGLQRTVRSAESVSKPVRRSRMPAPLRPKLTLVVPDEPISPPPEETSGGVSLMELKWFHCRDVLDPHGGKDGLALYCGKRVRGVLDSFCAEHAAIYYRQTPYIKRR